MAVRMTWHWEQGTIVLLPGGIKLKFTEGIEILRSSWFGVASQHQHARVLHYSVSTCTNPTKRASGIK